MSSAVIASEAKQSLIYQIRVAVFVDRDGFSDWFVQFYQSDASC